jgi:hypothetical protein|tara:strand:- start:1622 stop:2425 length:804 start_codon:yes stop_codon:yes gene_type:complete
MGLFKSIKKAFKKITGGIKKAVKGVIKGVKKISKSKLFKAIVIAAAIIVTGGAAIAAFTGGAGVTAGTFGATFGNWMMGTSQAVTGGTLFGTSTALARGAGTAAKVIASPFKAIGTAAGTAAGAVTDFTGLTTEASRAGVTPAIGKEAVLAETKAAADAAAAAKAAETGSTFATNYPKTSAFLKTVGTNVATSVATGYAMQQIAGDPDLTGSMSGLRTEGATDFDPLRVYAAERGIADSDISKYFTFANTPEGGNMPLFQQETLQVS